MRRIRTNTTKRIVITMLTFAGLAVLAPEAATADDLGLEAAPTTGATAQQEFELPVTPTESAASVPIVVRQKGSTALAGVRLQGVVAGKELKFAVVGAAEDGSFTVPPAGGEVLVSVSVSGVTAPVDGRGDVFATVGSRPQKLAQIHLVKLATAAVILDEATSGAVTFTSDELRFQRDLHVTSTAAVPTNVQILVSPLRHDGGDEAAVTTFVGGAPYAGTPLPLPALGQLTIRVGSDLPRNGQWAGTITVVFDTTRAVTQLKVTRERLAPTITVDDIVAAQQTLSAWHWTPWGDDHSSVSFRVNLTETAGQTLDLSAPSILPLLRADGTNKFQVDPEQVEILVDDKPTSVIHVPADGQVSFVVRVSDLDTGAYTGTLRFANTGTPNTDKTFSLFVRDSRWVAAALIALAVIASALLRWFLTTARTRMVAREQLIERAADITRMVKATEPHSSAQMEVALSVRARLDDLLRSNARKTATSAQLEDMDRRVTLLGHWLAVWKLVDAAGADKRTELATVEAVLRSDQVPEASRKAADDTLAAVETAVVGKKPLSEQIDELEHDLDARLAALAANDPRRPQVDAWKGLLNDARAAAPAAAAEKLAEVQLAWAGHLIDDLENQVKAPAPPNEMNAAEWAALKKDVTAAVTKARAATTTTDKISSYEVGAGLLLTGLAEALQEMLTSKANAQRPGKPELAGKLDNLARDAARTAALARAKQIDQATADYSSIITSYGQLVTDLRAQGVQLGDPAAAEPAPAPTPAGEAARPAPETPTPPPVPKLSPVPSRRSLVINRALGEGAVTALMLVAAVILGLFLFYDTTPSWGGWKDMATVILWGLGLHQVGATTAFGGLADLRTRFTADPPNS